MKAYYAMALLLQLVSASISQDKRKNAYLLFLWFKIMNETKNKPNGIEGWPLKKISEYPSDPDAHQSLFDNLL